VSQLLVVVIAAPSLLPAVRARAGDAEIAAFTDAEAVRALEVIVSRRPARVVLERLFASTSRGVALINRMRADGRLAQMEIQIVAHDSEYVRVSAARPASTGDAPRPGSAAPLDRQGTRREPRVVIRDGVDVLVDGGPVRLVDLSAIGAQVTSAAVLKPGQKIRVSLVDDLGAVRMPAEVVWAAFELPQDRRHPPQYRAGVEFLQPDRQRVREFAQRHAHTEE
jgi:PilZ domain